MSRGNQTRLRIQKLLVLIENHLAGIVHGCHAQSRALPGAEHLPRHNVGVMLQPRDDDLVALVDVVNSGPPG